MKDFKNGTRVHFINTGGDLDGKTGTITGMAMDFGDFRHFIVSLDEPLKDGFTSLVMTEHCLDFVPTKHSNVTKAKILSKHEHLSTGDWGKTGHILCDNMPQEEWEKEKPHLWEIVETDNELQVWVDTAYGQLVLWDNNELVGYGKHHITYSKCVVMDKYYYGVDKYLWK